MPVFPVHSRRSGFTLIELAIVLTIIAVIIGGGLSIYADKLQAGRVELTRNRLDRVEDALRQYVQTYGTLPCPARGDVGIDQVIAGTPLFGRQSCDPTGQGSAGSYYYTDEGQRTKEGSSSYRRYVIVGVVPTRTLSIPDAYAFDGWNDRIMYAVDTDFSYNTSGASTSASWSAGAAKITVYDANGNEKTNCGTQCAGVGPGAKAVYVLISYGANNYGAWRDKANAGDARLSAATIGTLNGTLEEMNAHFLTGFNDQFRDATITYSDNTATYVDDFVRWKTQFQF